MEFIERIPTIRLHYLLTLSFKEYKQHDKSSSKNDDERKKNYDKMRSFCENFIKANGEIKRLYKFTGDHKWSENGDGSGRLFSHGNGVQGLPKKIRGFLLDGFTTDIDMVNAHPVILRYLCRIHNIPHKELEFYIENRDEILSEFSDRETGKTLFLKATNDDKLNKKEKNENFKKYDKEMKEIQKMVTKLTCYENIVADVPANRLYNWYGSAMNRIMCYYENKILQVIMAELNKKRIEVVAPMFDGCMVYGDYYSNEELLNDLETAINTTFPSLNMKLSFKQHSKDILMPDDFQIPTNKPSEEDINSFQKVSEEFEKHHCKIINKAIFIKEFENDTIVMSKQAIKSSYEHLIYEKLNKDGDVIQDNFINSWLTNNPNQRCYDDIGVYPNESKCPSNVFNMWRKFPMEYVSDYEHKEVELQAILNHIKILSGNNEEVFEYFIKWIAQMIQYPEIKSNCPTLISSEGAGKGTLMKLFCGMLGSSKVFETTTPSRDVWGDFNGRMCNTFLINLNELSRKETMECEGRIKGLITDPKLTINNKGVNQYEIDSFHRFISTTNNQEPIKTTQDDRRNWIVRSSDEKCGDKEYFNYLHSILEDINVIKTCYEYFKSIPDMDKFNLLPLPKTDYHNNLKKLSENPVEMWLEAFTLKNFDKEEVELLGSEACKLFKEWCSENEMKYDIDSKKLGVRLSLLKINAIKKGRHTNKGETKIYSISELKKHFKLDCIIKLDNSDNDDDEVEEIDY
jgi:hypothetical protein